MDILNVDAVFILDIKNERPRAFKSFNDASKSFQDSYSFMNKLSVTQVSSYVWIIGDGSTSPLGSIKKVDFFDGYIKF